MPKIWAARILAAYGPWRRESDQVSELSSIGALSGAKWHLGGNVEGGGDDVSLLMDNRELLDGYRRGEASALQQIYDHYARQVARCVRGGFVYETKDGVKRCRGIREPVDQHACIHDVFLAAFTPPARHGYSGLRPFGAYLHGITKNLMLSQWRRREELWSPEDVDAEPSPLESPETAAGRKRQKELATAFLTTLSDDDRRFVELRFMVDELCQVESGRRMGWTRKKTRLQEQKIREKLTRFLKQRGGLGRLDEVES